MTRIDCDIAVLGSGFGGTLAAIIARSLGRSAVVLERGAHPRFAIGESSTPLADFKLAAIADRFHLPWLRPFAKYGTWKSAHPDIPCGLKRGFSFFKHRAGRRFEHTPENANALLVAASGDDAGSDTHWFRAAFDAHLVQQAVDAGADYFDHFTTTAVRHGQHGWDLDGVRNEEEVRIQARFVLDATGAGQALAETLDLKPVAPTQLRARSRALYSHFTGVELWHDVLTEEHGSAAAADHTFPCDAAALHQIIDGGWMWVLRFENGITSAGFSLNPEMHPLRADETAEQEWERLVGRYPSLARQFRRAEPVQPFVRTGRLQRRFTQAAGSDWALLPHAAGFLDAWLSPGIAQTLYAVNRLGSIIGDTSPGPERAERLAGYSAAVLRELEWVDEITGTCFECLDRFPAATTAAMVYFTAAINCELRERAGRAGPDDAFLMADDPGYRRTAAELFRLCRAGGGEVVEHGRRLLEPYNVCNLCDPGRRNMYPHVAHIP